MAHLMRLVAKSARARWRNLLLVAGVLALTTASTSALLVLVVGSPDLSGRAALAFGPNLVITPKPVARASADGGLFDIDPASTATLPESSLARLGTIRHAQRLTAVAAVLEGTAVASPSIPGREMPDRLVPVVGTWFTDQAQALGLPGAATRGQDVFSWWRVEGAGPGGGTGGAEALVGRRAAQALMLAPGDALGLQAADGRTTVRFVVSGVLSTGDADEERIVIDLPAAQALLGLPGRVSRVYLAAAVVPDDDLARLDPDRMSDREYGQWYCTPYLGSVGRQASEAIAGSEARPLRQVSSMNVRVDERLAAFSAAMVLIVGASSCAAVGAATAARQLDRGRESALLEALGAAPTFAHRLTLAENLTGAAAGAGAGLVVGLALAGTITTLAFGVALPPSPAALLGAFALALVSTAVGTRIALRLLSKRSLTSILGGA